MEIDLNKSFINENIQMTSKYIKTCLLSFVIRDMQIKAIMRYHYIPLIIAKINSTDNTKTDKDTDKELSYITNGNEKWNRYYAK